MNAPSAWSTRPAAPAFASGGWTARPRYAPADFVTLLWRERWLMLTVFAVVLAAGLAMAMTLKTTYAAHASLLARLGQEYVYEPRVGDAARGTVPNGDEVIQSEVEILGSAALRERTLQALGMDKVAPKLAADYERADAAKRAQITAAVVAGMGRALKVESAPDDSVIRLTYSAGDPQTAAVVLNALMQQYLVYRKSVLLQGAGPATAAERTIFEQKLADADQALQTFLTQNGVADFDSERTSLSTLHASLVDEDFRVQAQLREVEGRLGEVKRQASSVSPEIGIYHDTNSAPNDKLLQLKLDRQDLLSRYKPDSDPVKDADRKIAEMQALIASGGANAQGAKRTGPNPVYQTVQTENLQLSAEAASLRERGAALDTQIQEVADEQLKLNGLEPQYDELSRNRDVLSADVKNLAAKAEEDQAAQAIAEKSNDNIRVIEAASSDLRGKSLRAPALAGAVLFAAFTAVCAGLLAMFLRPGLATASSAARTLDLPVLATAEYKPNMR